MIISISLSFRLDDLDATWSYLAQIARLHRANREYPMPRSDSEDEEGEAETGETEKHDQQPSTTSTLIAQAAAEAPVDLDENEEDTRPQVTTITSKRRKSARGMKRAMNTSSDGEPATPQTKSPRKKRMAVLPL